MRYFLTGKPGIGKTTAIIKIIEILEQQNIRVGGMVTKELREGSIRIGFEVEDIIDKRKGLLAVSNEDGEPRIGRYHVRINEFEEIGVTALEKALDNAEVIVCDEIGPMELLSSKFIKLINTILESDKHIIGTVHWRAKHPLVHKIYNIGKVIEITYSNRNTLPEIIGSEIIKAIKGEHYGKHDS